MFTNMDLKLQALGPKAMRTFGATSRLKKPAKSLRERQRSAAASIKFGMPLNVQVPERLAITHVKFFGKNGTETELF